MKCTQVVLFFGPPGSGKGSLARMCEQKLGWAQLSTGDLFRKNISEGTELGKQIAFAIKSGKLVDDKVVIDTVEGWIKEQISIASAIICDGFPRTVAQGQMFLELMERNFPEIKVFLVKLELSDQKVIERLEARRVCVNKACQSIYSIFGQTQEITKCDVCGHEVVQRNDDKPETIKTRLAIYHHHADALLDFYKKKGIEVRELGVNKPLSEVFESFVTLVNG